MMEVFPSCLLVDANILIRAACSPRENLLRLLTNKDIELYSTMSIWREFGKYLRENREDARRNIWEIKRYVELVEVNVCTQGSHYKQSAHARLPPVSRRRRGPSPDWELVAVLLAFFKPDCAILSNDKDFWGAGVPVWTLERLMSYLREFRPVN